MKYPVILVLSEGNTKPQEIIDNIRKIPSSEENEVLIANHNQQDLIGYVLSLETKYYKTKLYLVPFENDISILPQNIKQSVECMIIFFDSQKKFFSKRIPSYVDFVNDNDIELAIFLCDKLIDSSDCITYKEIKEASRSFDIIELEREKEDENDLHDPLGYDEIMQTLRSVLWSNVNVEGGSHSTQKNSNDSKSDSSSSRSMETELEEFEKLLTEVMHFKSNSSTWSRNERLAYMEKFADKFQCLLSDNDSNSDDNEIEN